MKMSKFGKAVESKVDLELLEPNKRGFREVTANRYDVTSPYNNVHNFIETPDLLILCDLKE